MFLALMLAAQAAPACTAPDAPPPELAGWSQQHPVSAATAMNVRAIPRLAIGGATSATLAPTSKVTYPLAPAKAAAPGSYGGLFAVSIARSGRYRVALGSGAWIDLLRDGKAQASAAHQHGPACSGVRKMVDFDLTPGSYILELSGNTAPTLAVMVAALPK